MQLDIFSPKAPPLFGLDISSSSVKMLEIVDAGKGAYRVERYVIEPLPRDATVDGNITAEEVVVRGKVMGVIRANRVILQDSAHVSSEIFHKKLSIEEGASFEGTSKRVEDPLNAQIAAAKPVSNGDGRYHEAQAAAA